MKSYVITTGVLFGLITIAHIWRMIVEPRMAKDPWYILLTVLAAALCFWASRLLKLLPQKADDRGNVETS